MGDTRVGKAANKEAEEEKDEIGDDWIAWALNTPAKPNQERETNKEVKQQGKGNMRSDLDREEVEWEMDQGADEDEDDQHWRRMFGKEWGDI